MGLKYENLKVFGMMRRMFANATVFRTIVMGFSGMLNHIQQIGPFFLLLSGHRLQGVARGDVGGIRGVFRAGVSKW